MRSPLSYFLPPQEPDPNEADKIAADYLAQSGVDGLGSGAASAPEAVPTPAAVPEKELPPAEAPQVQEQAAAPVPDKGVVQLPEVSVQAASPGADVGPDAPPDDAAPAPAAAPQPAPSSQPQPVPDLEAERIKKLKDEAYQKAFGQETPAAAQKNPVLASTAPAWYESLRPPPVKSSIGSDVLKTVLGSLLGATREEKRHNTLAGLTGMVDNIKNQPHAQFGNELGAATAQSKLYRTMNPVSGKGGRDGDPLGMLNYLARERQMGDAEAKDAAKTKAAQENADPNSEVSKKKRRAAVSANILSADQANEMSGDQIDQFRVNFGQQAQRDWSGSEHDRTMMNREGLKVDAEQRAEMDRLNKEHRDQEVKDVEGYVPGTKYVTGHAPPPDSQKKFVEMQKAMTSLTDNAQRLKDIQARYDQVKTTGLAAVDKWIGSSEEKKLLAEAKLAQFNMSAALRSEQLANMGVPQQFEMALVNGVNPQAGSITELFQGPVAWDAMINQYSDAAAKRAPSYGYLLPNSPAPEGKAPTLTSDNPAAGVTPRAKPAYQPYKGHGGAATPSAPAAPSGIVGRYLIKSSTGQPVSRPLNAKQFKALSQMNMILGEAPP